MAKSAEKLCRMLSLSLLAPLSLWYDPVSRFGLPVDTAPQAATASPLICFIPGLDGTTASPFVQWPPLVNAGYRIRVYDARAEPVAATIDAEVGCILDFLREADAPQTLLMGESYGGVVAASAALREPSLVSSLVLVNPASAFSEMPSLQADARTLSKVPQALFPAASFALLGRKTFDAGFVATAVRDVLVERKLEKLRESEPALAAYYDAALAHLVDEISSQPPKCWFDARFANLRAGCGLLEEGWEALQPPLLVVAGTADALLRSDVEAARLAARLGPQRCSVHLVEGAGHAGTLDARCDLRAVIGRWEAERAARRGGAVAAS